MTVSPDAQILHASCVAIAGRALLITGASGSGKSSLALQMMGFGADLVADDRVQIERRGRQLFASSPDAIRGLIEARGLGLLQADVCTDAEIIATLSLDTVETARLPMRRTTVVLDVALPAFYRLDGPHCAAAFVQFLKGGALNPDDTL